MSLEKLKDKTKNFNSETKEKLFNIFKETEIFKNELEKEILESLNLKDIKNLSFDEVFNILNHTESVSKNSFPFYNSITIENRIELIFDEDKFQRPVLSQDFEILDLEDLLNKKLYLDEYLDSF